MGLLIQVKYLKYKAEGDKNGDAPSTHENIYILIIIISQFLQRSIFVVTEFNLI